MKSGMSLQELAGEVVRQRDAKQDFVGPTSMMTMVAGEGELGLALDGHGDYGVMRHAHRQIGTHTKIPARYYDRMLEGAPDLLADNVNYWLHAAPEKRLMRTLDGALRAFLSDRYRPLDNMNLLEAILPSLEKAGAHVQSAQVTDTKLYVKAVVADRVERIPPPDGGKDWGNRNVVEIQPGIVISNSEVGMGAVSVQPAVHTLACLNMAVWAQDALRKHHLGARLSGDEDGLNRYLSDETRRLSDASLWSQIADITQAALFGELFDDIIEHLRQSRERGMAGDQVEHVIEQVSLGYSLNEVERGGVLAHLIGGGDLSQWGLHSAVTRMSQDVDNYDRASELEVIGGKIVELPDRDWDRLLLGA